MTTNQSVMTSLAQPYLEGLTEHVLRYQHCSACARKPLLTMLVSFVEPSRSVGTRQPGVVMYTQLPWSVEHLQMLSVRWHPTPSWW